MRSFFSFLLPAILSFFALGQTSTSVCGGCIRKNMEFLASDELRGRGSGTEDEHRAAEYIGERLKRYGIQPAGDGGGYIQQATVVNRPITAPPRLTITPGTGTASTLVYGRDFLVLHVSGVTFSGPLVKLQGDKPMPKIAAGSVVLVLGTDWDKNREAAGAALSAEVSGVLMQSVENDAHRFESRAGKLPKLSPQLLGESDTGLASGANVLELSTKAADQLAKSPDNTRVDFAAKADSQQSYTWNAVGVLPGSDPLLSRAAVLLSAHLDHLGVGKPVAGDAIYNGADDDASGTAAVLEIARVLGALPKPKRTVIFALFGSEESGGLGSTYFREHPPVPLANIAANLEFEMIGRADPKVKADTVWLTGWERSNLGPVLAEHGAHLVPDPHPDEDFFARSDNYVLAKKGVVAQTISSYGLHAEYHQPSDDLAHIDFHHMTEAIGSLLAPVEWLVNSDFKPQWSKGGQP